jgi:hypothetical protein
MAFPTAHEILQENESVAAASGCMLEKPRRHTHRMAFSTFRKEHAMPGIRLANHRHLGLGIAAVLLAVSTLPAQTLPKGPGKGVDVARRIDEEIDRKLAEQKIPASPQADDAEFVRRVTLDLIGRVPTAAEAVAFLDDKTADKRARLIDDLLGRPEYGRHFGILWQNRIVPLNGENTREFNKTLFVWLAEGFNANRPWGQTVSALLLAEGELGKEPTLGFYLSPANQVDRYVQPERVAGSVAQLFLGVNLRCAQCHNHPFAKWKQTEFWGVAAFFGRVGYTKEAKEKRLVESAKIITKDGAPMASARPDATIQIPGKEKIVKARFLEGDEPALDPNESFRGAFVKWLVSAENHRFAAAASNRLWAHFFGRGIVNPADDIHDDNPPTHPELLKLLAAEFAASGHDQKHLIRCLCNSKAYQRSSRPLPENKADRELYSHMTLKQLSPEVLWDSLAMIMDGRMIDRDLVKSVADPGRGFWVMSFNSQEAGEDATRYTHGVPQTLKMLNSGLMHANSPTVRAVLKDKLTWEQSSELIYLTALARRPTPDELKLWEKYRDEVKNPERTYRTMLWTLANTSEFVFNH